MSSMVTNSDQYQFSMMGPSRIYTLQSLDEKGETKNVNRRYRDFLELHSFLIDKFISKFIVFAFPVKSIFNKLEDRSLKLQKYLVYVTEHFACDELKQWLCNQNYRLPLVPQASTTQRVYASVLNYVSRWRKTESEDEYELHVRDPYN